MRFSRPEYCSGEPFPSPGDLPNPGIKPESPAWQADSLPAEPPGEPKRRGLRAVVGFLQKLPQGLLWLLLFTALTSCPPPPPKSPPSGTPAQAAPGDRRDRGASSQTQGGAGRSLRHGHQTGCRWPFTVRTVTAAWCCEGDGFRHHTRSGTTGSTQAPSSLWALLVLK